MNIKTPIIPTMITVHLGKPDEAAKNITVPFREYIKNVASSELYSNWPYDSLKANILAIISFALNRIYNEWYYSKGYDFDITNSYLYDQTFVENRPFFENIADIVDDIFNNYIVKGEQVQPLFAQYCDGKTTTCEGLSQWGSVTLANQGKNPTDILKAYYGNNIKVIYNVAVGENIPSYPNRPIKIGDAGDYIRTIKVQLNRISDNYPAIPKNTTINEVFDSELEKSVRAFQNIFSLQENGIIDKSTWYKIKYIYNAVKRVSDLYSEGISIGEAELLYTAELKLGDTDPGIKELKFFLETIALFDPNIPYVTLTDTFDENMQEVVIAFQNKYNIPATGIINVPTWAKIQEVYKNTIAYIKSQDIEEYDKYYPGIFLTLGMTGPDVTKLQKLLLAICKKNHSIPGVKLNGTFDSLTDSSVKTIQKRNNITDDGIVGPRTWDAIVKEIES